MYFLMNFTNTVRLDNFLIVFWGINSINSGELESMRYFRSDDKDLIVSCTKSLTYSFLSLILYYLSIN